MIGVTRLETEVEGIHLRGNLHLDPSGNFKLCLITPYLAPESQFSFPRTYRKIWEEHSSEVIEFAAKELKLLYKACETLKSQLPPLETKLKLFWNQMEGFPVITQSEWNSKRSFLKKALQEGYMESSIYEKTLRELRTLMEEKTAERENLCATFLRENFNLSAPSQNYYLWVQFLYEQTEKKHLVVL